MRGFLELPVHQGGLLVQFSPRRQGCKRGTDGVGPLGHQVHVCDGLGHHAVGMGRGSRHCTGDAFGQRRKTSRTRGLQKIMPGREVLVNARAGQPGPAISWQPLIITNLESTL